MTKVHFEYFSATWICARAMKRIYFLSDLYGNKPGSFYQRVHTQRIYALENEIHLFFKKLLFSTWVFADLRIYVYIVLLFHLKRLQSAFSYLFYVIVS